MRQRIGAADHEAVEGQPRIERRAAERLVHEAPPARIGRWSPVDVAGRSRVARLGSAFGLTRVVAQHRRAHDELDAPHRRLFRLPAGEHAFGIMRLNPTLEEAGRHGQADGAVFHPFQVHAGKPTRENVVADFGAQALLEP